MADFSISQSNLKTYSFYKKLSPLKASAIMLGLDPIYSDRVSFQDKHGGEIRLLADILEQLAFDGEFIDIVKGEEVYINGISEYIESISTAELKNWALSNGYQWLGQTEISALDKLELNIRSFVEYDEQIQRELQEKADRIAELEQQLEELKQKLAQSTQPPIVSNSQSYNPTERETHLQMIYGLTCLLSKREINHQRYIRGDNINKSMIASDLERELQGIFITPKTAEGFRNRLTDILK